MPRIKITMEAEVGDLKGFWPDDPPGVMRQNVWSLLNGLKIKLLEQLMNHVATTDLDVVTKEAYERALREELTLVERLLSHMRVEVTS